MMKRKLAILLSSVVAGVGLVGATFAAWAVTDNADPFGIKISPGDITETITYDELTLDWGDTSKFSMVKNLQVSTSTQDNSVLRYVEVVATDTHVASSNEQPVANTAGKLTASFDDQTVRENNYSGAKLIDYLHVDVYKVASTSTTEVAETNKVLSLPSDGTGAARYANSGNVTVPNGSEQALAFKIYLPDTELTTQIYEQIKNDVVYLEIDWNKADGYEEAQGSIIYYSGTHDSNFTPKIYAWSSTSIANNGEFGSVDMELVEGTNVYSYVLSNTFDRVIFIYGTENETWKQTGNIEVTASIRSNTPMYNGSAWEKLALLGHGYYVVGNMNGWKATADGKLTNPVDGVYTTSITVSGEPVEFKVLYTVDNTYFGEYSNTGGENFRLEQAGTYTVQFSPTQSLLNGDQHVFIKASNA